jgi:aspartyl-tRNA(Asn)/glutamyl-tRNA(Gln) amidotransferase subunit B
VLVNADLVEQVRSSMPELPAARRARYAAEFGLTLYEVGVLTQERETADYFEVVAAAVENRKAAANWVMTEVLRVAHESSESIAGAAPAPAETASLLRMVEQSKISLNAAKTAFAAMVKSRASAASTVASLGLAQVSDEVEIAAACDRVLDAEPDKVAEYRNGRDKLFGFFVGQVMKAMGGRGNPKVVNETLRRKLAG